MISLRDFDKINEFQQDGFSKILSHRMYLTHLTDEEFAELWTRVKVSRLADILMRYLGVEAFSTRDGDGQPVVLVETFDGTISFTHEEFLVRYGYLMG